MLPDASSGILGNGRPHNMGKAWLHAWCMACSPGSMHASIYCRGLLVHATSSCCPKRATTLHHKCPAVPADSIIRPAGDGLDGFQQWPLVDVGQLLQG